MGLQRSNVQLAPLAGNIYGIYNGHAKTEIGYIGALFFQNLNMTKEQFKNKTFSDILSMITF